MLSVVMLNVVMLSAVAPTEMYYNFFTLREVTLYCNSKKVCTTPTQNAFLALLTNVTMPLGDKITHITIVKKVL